MKLNKLHPLVNMPNWMEEEMQDIISENDRLAAELQINLQQMIDLYQTASINSEQFVNAIRDIFRASKL